MNQYQRRPRNHGCHLLLVCCTMTMMKVLVLCVALVWPNPKAVEAFSSLAQLRRTGGTSFSTTTTTTSLAVSVSTTQQQQQHAAAAAATERSTMKRFQNTWNTNGKSRSRNDDYAVFPNAAFNDETNNSNNNNERDTSSSLLSIPNPQRSLSEWNTEIKYKKNNNKNNNNGRRPRNKYNNNNNKKDHLDDDEEAFERALEQAADSMTDQMTLLRSQTEAAIRGRDLPRTAIRATRVVQAMHQAGRRAPVLSYNAVLKGWKAYATQQRQNRPAWEAAVLQAEQLLRDMDARRAADVVSYTTLIAMLALRDEEIETAQRAEAIFDQMERRAAALLEEEEQAKQQQLEETTTTTINENAKTSRRPLFSADLQALSTYAQRNQPNARTRNAVLRAWANANDLPRAIRLLASWEADDKVANVQCTTASYATVMAGYARSKSYTPDEKLMAVHRLWNRLWNRYQPPSTTSATNDGNNNNDAASSSTSSAAQPVQGLPGCRPNMFALSILVGVCLQHQTPKAAKIATQAVARFYELQRTVPVEPEAMLDSDNTEEDEQDERNSIGNQQQQQRQPKYRHIHNIHAQLLTSVLDCWQKSGDDRQSGEQAERLLRWMVQEYQNTGDEDLRPNAFSFSTTMGAWARTRVFEKAERAQQLLHWMKDLHQQGIVAEPPNVFCYTAVINACAYSEICDAKALQIAVETFRELRSDAVSDSPTNITYAAMMTALRRLQPPSHARNKAAHLVFREAMDAGQVCPLFLQRLHSTVGPETLKQILGDNVSFQGAEYKLVSADRIPSYWRRNVDRIYPPRMKPDYQQ